MDVDVTDETLFIDDKKSSFGVTFCAQHPVFLSYFAMRPKVAQQRIIDTAQALSPSFKTGYVINGYAQDLGI